MSLPLYIESSKFPARNQKTKIKNNFFIYPFKSGIFTQYLLKFIPVLFLVLLNSCKKDSPTIPANEPKKILSLGHTRTGADFEIDEEVAQIDFNQFELLLLGGDLSVESSQDSAVLNWLDQVYDIGNQNTLWALGNHDYANPALIPDFTNRPLFYSHSWKNITFIVLDTQESSSNMTTPQVQLINSVIDTLSETKYLVLLHHKLMWMSGHPELESQIGEVANGQAGSCGYCTNPNNFYEAVYPKLLEAKENGIEVICLGGDIGFQVKSFEYLTSDGIWFLASGINTFEAGSEALVFEHDEMTAALTWRFKVLSELF